LIKNLKESNFKDTLFLPNEINTIKKRFEKVAQTKDVVTCLNLGDPEKGVLIPILCPLPS